ncbi:methyltransferase domain-containing protein [Ruegeria halocynthiae]|uniref:methyltransferase domain-containing protein n=1 Tax=Ruegeria halocynthiae TaxID=985054 RepID=UPI000690AAC2|nr:methyltransferase domain-containing protein [Ruegeria halocynthiae]
MNTQSTARVQRSFSRSFGTYHESAGQQARIAGHLVQELRNSGAPKQFSSALEFGCGTGHLTHQLCTAFELGALTINDLSPEAHQTATDVGANFLCGDAETVDWPDQPDLVASASMIQWLPDPTAFLRRIASALAPGGWLVVSGFGPEQYRELVQIGTAAKAPGLRQPADLAAAVQGDLEIMSTGESLRQMHFASPRKVLEHLRQTGVNGRAQRPWTRSTLARFTDEYAQQFTTEAGVSLTYHPTWIIARKRG